ncbi:winged helix-turn-helix domain-containing protein [Paenibacillus rhizovicinus]|uniref:Winged helix-turn-helix domain-containing protein n=1 Tax=Paenibacillus rhizovicinus TaxID=2704463 RepID=A0A6C0NXT2_9BACL|nr:crosslink repair DNA glycosylase YcaQ family protein [Paenibacillus rhizovicinus]QHW30951.1 winged helix-turn-helix domain-containing protein [Paenibacillus rhizovicinus]
MSRYRLTKKEARRFLLLKQGLLGAYKYKGKEGIREFVSRAGCIQFDPIDVCGKNAELVLQSRVAGFTKELLGELLYEDRMLVDYFDKQLAIIAIEDWKYFERTRERFRLQGRSRDKVDSVAGEVKRFIRENGAACSKDVPLKETVDWSWSPTTLSRAVLETLYFRGDLIVHHKKGTIKYYALAEDHILPAILRAEDPNESDADYIKWLVLRRIRSVGLLWNKPSDAWLGIEPMKAQARKDAFASLLQEKAIVACSVEGIADPLYIALEDEPLLLAVLSSTAEHERRVEFLAPLDNFLWDRKLIKALFDFEYKWEIYTPVAERKYGYYVLPVLYGEALVGRIELVADKKAKLLNAVRYWPEIEGEPDEAFRRMLDERIERFAAFNGCTTIAYGKPLP